MTKSIYNFIGIHQLFKLYGTHRRGYEPCRRALVVFFMTTISVLASFALTPLNETDVYNRIMERKSMEGYTEGTPWTNSVPYDYEHPYLNSVEFDGYPAGCYGGVGCFAFMMSMMEYACNYEYPIRVIECTYNTLPKIRIGDGIRVDNDVHSVFVIGVDSDGHTVTVAEGNMNSKVHWGRKIDLADPSSGVCNVSTFWPEEEPALDITISEYGYATFYYSNSAYVIPQGIEAKAVENISGNTINLLPVSGIIPAGFAVILEGDPGTYTFEPTSEEGTRVENKLRGTDETKTITPESQNCKYYKLSVVNDRVGFYFGGNNGAIFENQAHKAYLPVPVSQSANSFLFDSATGIDNMQATGENAEHVIYNLSGQRVSDSYKGVVIINGKKVLRK